MATEAMKRQQEYQRQQQQEGTITVDYIPNKTKGAKGTNTSRGGDYIDFEEVK